MEIIATIPLEIQEEVLLTSSDAVLSNLTPALVVEANMLRKRAARCYNRILFGMLPRSRRDYFELSTVLLNLVLIMQFFGLEQRCSHAHIDIAKQDHFYDEVLPYVQRAYTSDKKNNLPLYFPSKAVEGVVLLHIAVVLILQNCPGHHGYCLSRYYVRICLSKQPQLTNKGKHGFSSPDFKPNSELTVFSRSNIIMLKIKETISIVPCNQKRREFQFKLQLTIPRFIKVIIYRPQVVQPPAYQAPDYQLQLLHDSWCIKEDFKPFVKDNDAVMEEHATLKEYLKTVNLGLAVVHHDSILSPDLPPHLEYAFLEGNDKFLVIIAKDLKNEEKAALIEVLKSHKRAMAWKLSDIKVITQSFVPQIRMRGSRTDGSASKAARCIKVAKKVGLSLQND
ncbi:hypothetical protein Tco_1318508 [Tanacetum coccineum]